MIDHPKQSRITDERKRVVIEGLVRTTPRAATDGITMEEADALYPRKSTVYTKVEVDGLLLDKADVGHTHSMLDLTDRVTGYTDPNYDVGTAKHLRWSRYGANHEIIDASGSQAPDLTSINQVDAATAWLPGMPVLMGWNGISTYGVRVDRSRYADSVEYGGVVRVSSTGAVVASQGTVSDLTPGQLVVPTSGGRLAGTAYATGDSVNGDWYFGGSKSIGSFPTRGVYLRSVGASFRSPRVELVETSGSASWSMESYFGKLRFVCGYNTTPASKLELDSSGNLVLGSTTDVASINKRFSVRQASGSAGGGEIYVQGNGAADDENSGKVYLGSNARAIGRTDTRTPLKLQVKNQVSGLWETAFAASHGATASPGVVIEMPLETTQATVKDLTPDDPMFASTGGRLATESASAFRSRIGIQSVGRRLWAEKDNAKTYANNERSILGATSAQRMLAANTISDGTVVRLVAVGSFQTSSSGSDLVVKLTCGPDGNYYSPYYLSSHGIPCAALTSVVWYKVEALLYFVGSGASAGAYVELTIQFFGADGVVSTYRNASTPGSPLDIDGSIDRYLDIFFQVSRGTSSYSTITPMHSSAEIITP